MRKVACPNRIQLSYIQSNPIDIKSHQLDMNPMACNHLSLSRSDQPAAPSPPYEYVHKHTHTTSQHRVKATRSRVLGGGKR